MGEEKNKTTLLEIIVFEKASAIPQKEEQRMQGQFTT